jgi:hypothetical protein
VSDRERIERVRITNRNTFVIKDMSDGVPWKFPPGESVIVPASVAFHLFNFPGDEEVMHAHMSRRWGWNRPEHCLRSR